LCPSLEKAATAETRVLKALSYSTDPVLGLPFSMII
jgi:hypothetical protein